MHKIGGLPAIFTIILVIGVFIFAVWVYIRRKAAKKARAQMQKYSFDNDELNDKRKILEDDTFTTADLPYQICRAYFRGTNTVSNQWTIPLEPPTKLKNIVFISSFEEFTTNLNNTAKWKRKEKILYYLLTLLFPPLMPIYLRIIRKKKFKKLREKINSIQRVIWLNSEGRRTNLLTKTIKISASIDYTMAYMDFLDLEKDMEQYNGPVLPLTFHLSGDGYFNSPFSLNRRDCLVKSLLHKFSESYIENLNSYLESLSFFEFLNISTSKFWSLIKFLHINNNGILKDKSIKAELAILEYLNKGNKTVKMHKSSQIDSINECSQAYIFHFDFINQHPETVKNIVDYCRFELYKRKKDIKLALIFSRVDQSTMTTREHHPEIQAVSPKSGFMSTNSYLMTKYNRSSVKHTKASIPYFYESGEEENNESDDSDEQHNLGGYIGSLKPNWEEPFIMKPNEDMVYDSMDKRSFSATGSVYSNASYAPNKIEVESYNDEEDMINFMVEEHPLIAFKNRRHGRDC